MDITDREQVEEFFAGNEFGTVVHCAALARMVECERNPALAAETNIVGTSNLVMAAIRKGEETGRGIRFVHISTDGVYPGKRGNYKEGDETVPYNNYGWTKLGAECAVRLLPDHCIIRTSFFDPGRVVFESSATDAFSSKVPIPYLVKAIARIAGHGFRGTVNIGSERMSEYERYREFKPSLKACSFESIVKSVGIPLARDASMDCSLWRRLEEET